MLRAVDDLYNIIPLLLRQTLGGTEGVRRRNRSSTKKGIKRKPIIAAVQCAGVVSREYIQLRGRQEEKKSMLTEQERQHNECERVQECVNTSMNVNNLMHM